MSDRLKILEMLEHGDVLIRKVDNGAVISYIGCNSDKYYSEEPQQLNPNALISNVAEFDEDDDSIESRRALMSCMYEILEGMGVYQSKHNKYKMEMRVIDNETYRDVDEHLFMDEENEDDNVQSMRLDVGQ